MTCVNCFRPTSGNWLCDRCALTLEYALTNIAAYWADLDTSTRTHDGGGYPAITVDGRLLGGVATMTATQTQWDTWATVVAWCRVVMEDQPGVPGPACRVCLHVGCADRRRTRWPDNNIPSMLRYLTRQQRWAIAQQWAPDMLDEMLDIERRLRRTIDIPAPRWYAGKCDCGGELYATTETGIIVCEVCGTEHDIATRRDRLLAEAKDHRVTATVAASALLAWTDYDGTSERLVDRIRRWRDGGRLEVADVTSLLGRDRHLYRLGDIQALLIEHAQHTQAQRMRG